MVISGRPSACHPFHAPSDKKMSRRQANHGFTLIELIVVMTLVSIIFFVATPRFSAFLFGDDADTTLRWLMVKIRHLKQTAVSEQKDYALHLDFENNTMWVTDDGMETEEALVKAQEQAYRLPEGVHLLDVEYYNSGRLALGIASIRFLKRGYSDRAIIHFSGRDENPHSVLIEPFLWDVITENQYLSYRSVE